MKLLLKLICTTLPAGLMTAVVWYWVNGFGKQNGQGILEQQIWPLNNIYWCAAIAIVLAIVSMVTFEFLTARRSSQMEAAAAMLGLEFSRTVSRNQLSIKGRLPIFDDWDEASNLLDGSVDGIHLQMFDYVSVTRSTSPGKGNDSQRVQQTVILIPLDDYCGPSFCMRRRNSLLSITSLLGFDGLSFEGDQTHAMEEQDQIRQFNDKYLVMQWNGDTADGGSQRSLQRMAEQSNLSLLKTLVNGRGWSLEVCESHAVFWVNRKRFKPDEVRQVIDESLQLFQNLTSDNASGPRLGVSGQAAMSDPISFASFGPVIASGCLGMVLAFGLFVPIFLKFADKAPWLVFVWPFFGMAIMAVCVILGAKIARRKR